MESNFMTAVSTVGLSVRNAQGGVSLLPVLGGFDGTRVSIANRTRVTATTKKNAGAAGTLGYPSWSHPV